MFAGVRRFILFLVGFSIPIQAESVPIVGAFRATPFKFAVGALMVLAALQLGQRKGRRPRDPNSLWVAAFATSWAIGIVMSLLAGLLPGRLLAAGTTLLALAAYYYLLGFTITTRRDLVAFLWALVLGGAVTAAPAVFGLQAVSGETASATRFTGLSGQENRFGHDMAACVAIAAGVFFAVRSTVRKVIVVIAVALALGGAALALSRAAFLALGVMWVYWLYRSGRSGNIAWAVPAVLLAVLALFLVPEAVEERIATAVDPELRAEDESIQLRFVQFTWALRAFMSNPLLGVGSGGFPAWVHTQPDTAGMQSHTVHNAYLSVAAEQGLFGFIPFVTIIALSWFAYGRVWRTVRARRAMRDPQLSEYGVYALYLQIAMIAPLVSGFFHQTHTSKFLWTLMGMAPVLTSLVHARIRELESHRESEASRSWSRSESAGMPLGRAPAR